MKTMNKPRRQGSPAVRDDPTQSKAFIEKAKEIEADEKESAADEVIGRLTKMPPEPRKKTAKS